MDKCCKEFSFKIKVYKNVESVVSFQYDRNMMKEFKSLVCMLAVLNSGRCDSFQLLLSQQQKGTGDAMKQNQTLVSHY